MGHPVYILSLEINESNNKGLMNNKFSNKQCFMAALHYRLLQIEFPIIAPLYLDYTNNARYISI